jgi:hypothetical protein
MNKIGCLKGQATSFFLNNFSNKKTTLSGGFSFEKIKHIQR